MVISGKVILNNLNLYYKIEGLRKKGARIFNFTQFVTHDARGEEVTRSDHRTA